MTFLCQLRSILIIIFKEEGFDFTTKIVEGDFFISMGMSFQATSLVPSFNVCTS